ncbi:hypothetical protein PM082_021499 [Marasmius tenuissimus]|nr:hypothetical protein PM082_021499 [Marasmius tenuissimus]
MIIPGPVSAISLQSHASSNLAIVQQSIRAESPPPPTFHYVERIPGPFCTDDRVHRGKLVSGRSRRS